MESRAAEAAASLVSAGAKSGAKSGATIGVMAAGAWPVISGSGGPGHLDPYDPARALIFETAQGGLRGDALARFFADEIDELDWLTDYLMDREVLDNEQEHGPSFSLEEEPEEEYEKKALTTTDTDLGWDIM